MPSRTSPEEVWEAMMARILKIRPRATVAVWLDPIKPVGVSENRLVLEIPNRKFAWVERRYGRFLGLLVREVSDLDGIVLRKAGARKVGDVAREAFGE